LTRSRTSFFIGSTAAVLYFSEGLPYGIVKDLVPLYLRVRGVDLTKIGILNAVAFAWTLKFLWSPLIDTFGTYRRWIGAAVAAVALALAAAAAVPIGPLFYAIVAMLAFASATQDVAVDAFTIRTTPDSLLGPINSIRVTAYRAALMAGGGALAWIADRAGWPSAFATGAVVAGVICAFSFTLPEERGVRTERPRIFADLAHWLQRPHAGVLLAIVFLYRLGELTIVAMVRLFWLDRGYSVSEIGTVTSVVGVILSVAGAVAGGWIVSHIGLWRALIWLGIAQTMSNLGYALVATFNTGRWSIWAAAVVENFGYGLGTAAFLAFLMSICDRDRAATEYALLSAAYGVTGTIMASASGYIAKHAGYPAFFWMTVVLGIPALLLLPAVRGMMSDE